MKAHTQKRKRSTKKTIKQTKKAEAARGLKKTRKHQKRKTTAAPQDEKAQAKIFSFLSHPSKTLEAVEKKQKLAAKTNVHVHAHVHVPQAFPTPWWNTHSATLSKLMWRPKTSTVSASGENISWTPSLKRLANSSWFHVRYHERKKLDILETSSFNETKDKRRRRIFWKEVHSRYEQKSLLEQNLTAMKVEQKKKTTKIDKDNKEKETGKKKKRPELKIRKICVFPTKQQKTKFQHWFDATRWVYNQAVAMFRDRQKNKLNFPTRKEYRDALVNDTAAQLQVPENKWVKEKSTSTLRDTAVDDLLAAIKSNKALERKTFDLKFRRRDAFNQTLTVSKRIWGSSGQYKDYLHAQKLRSVEELPKRLEFDSRLVKTRLGRYFICIPVPIQPLSLNAAPKYFGSEAWKNTCNALEFKERQKEKTSYQTQSQPQHGVIALDPGVRCFLTGYDPNGTVVEWGLGDIQRIHRLCLHVDKIQSQIDLSWQQSGVRARKRYRLKKVQARIRLKIRNLVDELHKRCAKWLCENYKVILLPIFQTSKMVARLKKYDMNLEKKVSSSQSQSQSQSQLQSQSQSNALDEKKITAYFPTIQDQFQDKDKKIKDTKKRKIKNSKSKSTQKVNKRKRYSRRISRKTARQMLTLSHYRFQQRLFAKVREYPWCRVLVCTEEYTTQTCRECGRLHKKIGGKKIFLCPHCGHEDHRDWGAALNVLNLFCTKNKIPISCFGSSHKELPLFEVGKRWDLSPWH